MNKWLKSQLSECSEMGCSLELFKKWIEYNFDDNMSWNNYGT